MAPPRGPSSRPEGATAPGPRARNLGRPERRGQSAAARRAPSRSPRVPMRVPRPRRFARPCASRAGGAAGPQGALQPRRSPRAASRLRPRETERKWLLRAACARPPGRRVIPAEPTPPPPAEAPPEAVPAGPGRPLSTTPGGPAPWGWEAGGPSWERVSGPGPEAPKYRGSIPQASARPASSLPGRPVSPGTPSAPRGRRTVLSAAPTAGEAAPRPRPLPLARPAPGCLRPVERPALPPPHLHAGPRQPPGRARLGRCHGARSPGLPAPGHQRLWLRGQSPTPGRGSHPGRLTPGPGPAPLTLPSPSPPASPPPPRPPRRWPVCLDVP